jgi:lipid-binding SYLF domain-containing protein
LASRVHVNPAKAGHEPGGENMKKAFGASCFVVAMAVSLPVIAETHAEEANHRLHEAASVFSEVTSAPDKGVPSDLISRAKCIVIVPGIKKGAFIVGAKYGKGFMSCRGHSDMSWSAPGAVVVEGGSFGFQIGGSETDAVMLVMNDSGEKKLLQSRFTLGGDASIAAGPVGRTASAETDAQMTAEILSWSRTKGIFAGVSLQGATLREDGETNEALYGSKLSNHDIVTKWHEKTEAAGELVGMLNKYSPMKMK